ncbi:porin family protein [Niabella beijingensis]|uniref:porin family protein n=1 Tax=Niabella beijingensis TaxID=2872700 RepID=UPI001CBC066F|nr:porin family protein [Niabella beijingensis]MBZ4191644.1 PorT family protein [Niabella beijingensis]
MKRYTLFIVVILIVKISFAQSKIEMGFKVGLSIPNLTSGNSDNPLSSGYSSQLNGYGAIQAEFHINKHFSIQPQLEHSVQGGKKNGMQAFKIPDEMAQQFPPGAAPAYLYADYKSQSKMTYLMLPILVKYRLDLKKNWGAYIAAGPFASYLLNAKNSTKGSSLIYLDKNKTQPLSPEPQSFDSNDNIISDLHRFNAGITGHLGLGYKIVRGSIFFEVGGNYGLIIIQKNSANGKNKTGAAVISLGYQYEL